MSSASFQRVRPIVEAWLQPFNDVTLVGSTTEYALWFFTLPSGTPGTLELMNDARLSQDGDVLCLSLQFDFPKPTTVDECLGLFCANEWLTNAAVVWKTFGADEALYIQTKAPLSTLQSIEDLRALYDHLCEGKQYIEEPDITD